MGLVLQPTASTCGNDRSCFVWKGHCQYCWTGGSSRCIPPVTRSFSCLQWCGMISSTWLNYHQLSIPPYIPIPISCQVLPNMWQSPSHHHLQMLQTLSMQLIHFASPRVSLWHPAAATSKYIKHLTNNQIKSKTMKLEASWPVVLVERLWHIILALSCILDPHLTCLPWRPRGAGLWTLPTWQRKRFTEWLCNIHLYPILLSMFIMVYIYVYYMFISH